MAGIKSGKDNKDKLWREAIGVLLIFIGLFLALALISYNPFDQSFTVTSSAKSHNYAGVVGSYLADGIINLSVGLAGYLFPILFVFLGVLVITGRTDSRIDFAIKS